MYGDKFQGSKFPGKDALSRNGSEGNLRGLEMPSILLWV